MFFSKLLIFTLTITVGCLAGDYGPVTQSIRPAERFSAPRKNALNRPTPLSALCNSTASSPAAVTGFNVSPDGSIVKSFDDYVRSPETLRFAKQMLGNSHGNYQGAVIDAVKRLIPAMASSDKELADVYQSMAGQLEGIKSFHELISKAQLPNAAAQAVAVLADDLNNPPSADKMNKDGANAVNAIISTVEREDADVAAKIPHVLLDLRRAMAKSS
eukprot:TRINITY_DN14257_c0_g1_i1.p1 TRINITY_DN14257_c0_g1~~TRINITY_DN14257_c0_g1_i1.p1  ORF type:complete len:216 (+),score=22.11 TRINITY_DN14257_c0_g1_i1:100-747(+)